ncbi:MAG: glycoside hydrolase family 19 protein [Tistlia sp.]|uniref:glycoside hydrolase family 19 protein n=1 Tax=Tistlia sp. TaxID=3057121 RepID=UPI0034A172D1
MPIDQAVGPACPNRSHDVRLLQILLNANRRRLGLAVPLAEDGLWGARTESALRRCRPDGLVRPGAAELAGLCAALPPGLSLERLACVLASDRARVAQFHAPLVGAMTAAGIATPLRRAHFLAQIGHESGGLRWTEELASGDAYEGRRDLGNREPGDGRRFKGRGLIQLTGRANYRAFGEAVGQDLLSEAGARRLAVEPALAVAAAIWFWTRHALNELADRDDLAAVTRRVNGGLTGLADRAAYLRRAKLLLPSI